MPEPSCSGPGRAVGTAPAARARRPARARSSLLDAGRLRKTTAKVPSGFSPKRVARIASARSELVPGTASDVVSSEGKRAAENAPSRATPSQATSTAAHHRTTARVHHSSTVASLLPGPDGGEGPNGPAWLLGAK